MKFCSVFSGRLFAELYIVYKHLLFICKNPQLSQQWNCSESGRGRVGANAFTSKIRRNIFQTFKLCVRQLEENRKLSSVFVDHSHSEDHSLYILSKSCTQIRVKCCTHFFDCKENIVLVNTFLFTKVPGISFVILTSCVPVLSFKTGVVFLPYVSPEIHGLTKRACFLSSDTD